MLDHRLDLGWEEDEPRRRRGAPPPNRRRPSGKQRRRKRRNRRGKSFLALSISILLMLVVGAGVYWGVGQLQEMFGPNDYAEGEQTSTEVQVTIASGSSGFQMGQELVDKGVVRSVDAFVTAFTAGGGDAIQPGTYRLYEKMTAANAVAALLDRANMVLNAVTIPEGFITLQIYQKLSEATGHPVADFQAAAANPTALGVPAEWFARSDGKSFPPTIEGFLFPATYEITPGETPAQILAKMVTKFLEVAQQLDFVGKVTAARGTTIPSSTVTPYDVLIAASIAQVEAGNVADLGKVARVVYNRVFTDLPYNEVGCQCLELDSAINYYFKISGETARDPDTFLLEEIHNPNNPYNTHDVAGLPRNPISNPGQAALEGALSPPAGDWLFFVAIDTAGNSLFADTYWEHQQNIAVSCQNGILTGESC